LVHVISELLLETPSEQGIKRYKYQYNYTIEP